MTTLTEAARQAIDAIEREAGPSALSHAAEALRAALAQAEPAFARESWQHAVDDALVLHGRTSEEFDTPHNAVAWLLERERETALALAAPAQAEPRMDEREVRRLLAVVEHAATQLGNAQARGDRESATYWRGVLTKHKSSAAPAQAEPQEPRLPDFIRRRIEQAIQESAHPKGMSLNDGKVRVLGADLAYLLRVLDTAPAQSDTRKPLTDEYIRNWWASENAMEDADMCKLDDFRQVIRAVEAAHGIKEQL